MKQHTAHKYQRKIFPDSKKVYYKCMLPNCSHYVLEFLVWNKIMLCNNCEEPFILTKRKQNQAKPKCLSCTGVKKKQIESLMEGLL